MAFNLGSVYATAELDTRHWDAGANRLTSSMDGIQIKSGSLLDSLGGLTDSIIRWGAVAAGVGGGGLAAFAFQSGMASARTDELTFALRATAKANGIEQAAVDNTVQKLRGLNIAHQQAVQITSKFVQANLKLTDALELSNAAKDLAVISGMNSSDAVNILTDAIVSQQPILLRQFGIITNLEPAYLSMGRKLGLVHDQTLKNGKVQQIWSRELNETEKQQALLNVVLEAGTKVSGVYEASFESVSKRYRSLTGRILPDFIEQIGKAFQPSLVIIIDKITASIESMSDWLTKNQDAVDKFGKSVAEFVEAAAGKFIDALKWLVDNRETLKQVAKVFGAFLILVKVAEAIRAVSAAISILETLIASPRMLLFFLGLGPVGAILLAIAATIGLLALAWSENWGDIQGKSEEAATAIEKTLNDTNEALGEGDKVIKGFIGDAVQGFDELNLIIGQADDALITFLTKDIPSATEQAGKDFAKMYENINAGLANFPDDMQRFLEDVSEGLGIVTATVEIEAPRIAEAFNRSIEKMPEQAAAVLSQVALQFTITLEAVRLSTETKVDEINVALMTLEEDIKTTFTNVGTWLSINIPLIVGAVVVLFTELPGKINDAIGELDVKIRKKFEGAWNAIISEVGTWPNRLAFWGSEMVNSMITGVANAIKGLAEAFRRGMDSVRAITQAKSPPKAGPLKDIDKWGFSLGKTYVDSIQKGLGTMSLNAPVASLDGASVGSLGGRGGMVVNQTNYITTPTDMGAAMAELNWRIQVK